jgi:lipopolysaccharide heptosyltransferase I
MAPKILIVKLSAIGDVVHTLPVLHALRTHWPDAHITWLVEEAAAELVLDHPNLDRVLISRRKHWARGLKTACRRHHLRAIVSFIRELRDTRYDMILDFQAALKGAMLIALAHGRRKIGFGPGMQHQEYSYLALNTRIPMVSMEIHALERGLMLLEAIGVPRGEIRYDLPIDAGIRQIADRLLGQHPDHVNRTAIAINPVAQWKTKLWPAERFADLADRLIEEHNAAIFFTGGPQDRPEIERIKTGMRHHAASLAGRTTLIELAAVYERMACIISTDTGPMHIAAAVRRPVVALFGPTAPQRTGPYGSCHRVVCAPVDCRPCFRRECDACRCMLDISVESVLDNVRSVLTMDHSSRTMKQW